jgi:hypothetical protein
MRDLAERLAAMNPPMAVYQASELFNGVKSFMRVVPQQIGHAALWTEVEQPRKEYIVKEVEFEMSSMRAIIKGIKIAVLH